MLGVPLWPYQAILAGQLLLLLLGGLFILSAFVPVHPAALYGPPGPNHGARLLRQFHFFYLAFQP